MNFQFLPYHTTEPDTQGVWHSRHSQAGVIMLPPKELLEGGYQMTFRMPRCVDTDKPLVLVVDAGTDFGFIPIDTIKSDSGRGQLGFLRMALKDDVDFIAGSARALLSPPPESVGDVPTNIHLDRPGEPDPLNHLDIVCAASDEIPPTDGPAELILPINPCGLEAIPFLQLITNSSEQIAAYETAYGALKQFLGITQNILSVVFILPEDLCDIPLCVMFEGMTKDHPSQQTQTLHALEVHGDQAFGTYDLGDESWQIDTNRRWQVVGLASTIEEPDEFAST